MKHGQQNVKINLWINALFFTTFSLMFCVLWIQHGPHSWKAELNKSFCSQSACLFKMYSTLLYKIQIIQYQPTYFVECLFMCQFEHSEIKCTVIVIRIFTFGKRKNSKLCYTILELLHRTKYFVWKIPRRWFLKNLRWWKMYYILVIFTAIHLETDL